MCGQAIRENWGPGAQWSFYVVSNCMSIVRSTISMHSMLMLGDVKYVLRKILKINALRLNLRGF